MARRILILSPMDLKRGAIAPDGRVVEKAELYYGEQATFVLAGVTFTDGSTTTIAWPNGEGWQVP